MPEQNIIEKLKASFSIQQTERGNCLVIPGIEWEPDWEAELPDNYEVIYEAGRVLIKLPKTISAKNENIRKGIVTGASVAAAKAQIPKPLKKVNRPIGNINGVVHRGKKWTPELDKKLIELMQSRELVELPMPYRAQVIKKMVPDPFPDRTTIALVQHYKQITTPAERATALAESLKPPVEKIRWENTNSRQEKYTLEKDGLKLTGIATFEKGVLQRVSALVTQKAGDQEGKVVVVNELPIDVLRLLNCLIDQIQEQQS